VDKLAGSPTAQQVATTSEQPTTPGVKVTRLDNGDLELTDVGKATLFDPLVSEPAGVVLEHSTRRLKDLASSECRMQSDAARSALQAVFRQVLLSA